jgi:hypothetical protein
MFPSPESKEHQTAQHRDTQRNANRGITMTEAEMKLNWKHTAGAFAVLGMAISGPASAQSRSEKARPAAASSGATQSAGSNEREKCRWCNVVIVLPPPTKTETPEAPKPSEAPTSERLDGRIAVNSKAVGTESAEAPKPGEGTPEAERGIKDKGVASCGSCGVTGREAAPGTGEAPAQGGPGGGPRVDAQGAGDPEATEKKKSRPKERDDPMHDPSKTSLLPVLGGAAALAAVVVAVSGGGDNAPTSP